MVCLAITADCWDSVWKATFLTRQVDSPQVLCNLALKDMSFEQEQIFTRL